MKANAEASQQEIVVSLEEFLTVTDCPPEWRNHDLYLFRDGDLVFYVGQSQNAFDRVWEHLRGAFKGRSVVGRFVLCNWPRSMRFTIELLDSKAPRFSSLGDKPDAAERYLIEQLSPCFNEAVNVSATPLPDRYLPPNARIRHLKSLKRMIREAGYAMRLRGNRRPWK